MNKKMLSVAIFLGILLLAGWVRLFLLGTIPAGLTNDEANTGYDSYSLLLTGKDQWGQHLPLVFKGFGDYPPPLYRYLAIPSIAVFGLNNFAVRLPSALFGIFSVVVIFFLVRKISNQTTGFIAMILLSISPWAIGLSRVAIESNVAVFFLLLGLLCFFIAHKRPVLFALGSIFFALTVYTYSAYVLLAPLFLFTFVGISFFTKQLSFRKAFVVIALFGLCISPLFLTRNTSAGNRFSQIGFLHNITSIGLINVLNDQRGACIRYIPPTICKFESNKILVFSTTLIKNYFSHFSLDFLYLSGNETQFSILPQRGLEYLLSFVLLVAGILVVSQKKYPQRFFLFFLLLAPIPDSLTSGGNYSRSFVILPFLTIIEAFGAYAIYSFILRIKHIATRYFLLVSTILICTIGVISFFITYFTYFQDYYSRFSQYGYQQVMTYIQHNKDIYNNVYISTHLNDTKQYIYYLFYTKYDPIQYQKKAGVTYHTSPDGWISIDRIDNIHFIPSLSATKIQKGDLLISHPSDFGKCQGIFIVKDRIGYGLFQATEAEEFIPCISTQ